MQRLFLFFLPLIGLSLATLGCQSEQAASDKQADQPKPMQGFVVALECRELSGPDSETPSAEVAIRVADQRMLLDTISVCQMIEAADYPTHEMPTQTVTACGGWWAGGGDYFYAVLDGDKIVVMQGWQEEGQTDKGYHYKEIKRIPLQ